MFDHARKRVILADYSKVGVVSRVSYCALVDADCVIVDVRARQNAMFPQLCSVNPNVVVA
ncbi:DeoR/GlpR family transcriptional regulator of sugar metabolism [Bradyrhizobium sp. USDA 4011]